MATKTSKTRAASFNGYVTVYRSNGVETGREPSTFPFKTVKQIAIDCLSDTLSRHHGRGNHTVTVYGARYVNRTPADRLAVGFLPDYQLTEVEEVFSL